MGWRDSRETVWEELPAPWDLVVVGGGITGAAILREASRMGYRGLLVEQGDFASGTSSRSSKLVHGGLRYIKEGKLHLTYSAVRERERLLAEAPGLVEPLNFLMPHYRAAKPKRVIMAFGLTLYDLMAGAWSHRYYPDHLFSMLAPHIRQVGLKGGFWFRDAETDDARLVLKLILDAVAEGAVALNYARCEELLKEGGRVCGILLRDTLTGRTARIRAGVVINASGVWADLLRAQVGGSPRLRPLRGSHLLFPAWRLPVAQSVSFLHPRDGRPVFAFPWEGVTLVGTTDVDHREPLDQEPSISAAEVSYLLEAVRAMFPPLAIGPGDILSTLSGVRPVIGSGKADPSQESREYAVWSEEGLLTATGGKLTTFRLQALDVLKACRRQLPPRRLANRLRPSLPARAPALPPSASLLDPAAVRRLTGRYGAAAPSLVEAALPGELEPVPGTPALWAELRWAARKEGVVHLDDLLLRRVRVGLLLPDGGEDHLEKVRALCAEELGWDGRRWKEEADRYLELWVKHYGPPAEDGNLPEEVPPRIPPAR
jgi:glycerol-3-phosphate dehydrogenase